MYYQHINLVLCAVDKIIKFIYHTLHILSSSSSTSLLNASYLNQHMLIGYHSSIFFTFSFKVYHFHMAVFLILSSNSSSSSIAVSKNNYLQVYIHFVLVILSNKIRTFWFIIFSEYEKLNSVFSYCINLLLLNLSMNSISKQTNQNIHI